MEFAENFDEKTQTVTVQLLVLDPKTGEYHGEPWVTVKKSTIEGAGQGVFADREFKKNQTLGYYTGEIVRFRADLKSDYLMEVTSRFVCDGANGGNWTRKINDGSRYANKSWKKSKVNAQFEANMELKATKTIPVGSELFVEYGKSYWDG